jgi:15-cis-phytoene synthase
MPSAHAALTPRPDPRLSPVAQSVRRHDPDRFLTALFAPPERRERLMLLYALNHELARAREVAREPTLALIRLHWWREALEGAPRRHELATPLAAALAEGALRAGDLLSLVDAREAETAPAIASLADWRAYVLGTAGALAMAAGRALGADADQCTRLAALGAAYGVAGQLRSVAALARQARCLLPQDVLGEHGLTVEAVIAAPDTPKLAPVMAELAGIGRDWLEQGRGRLPRGVLAAGLPGVLARRDLRRPGALPGPRGLGDRLAVMAAYAAGSL